MNLIENYPALSLLPPLLTIFFVFLTRKTLASLFVGIATAAAIKSNFNPLVTLTSIFEKILKTSQIQNLTSFSTIMQSDKLFLLVFLLFLSFLISLIVNAGVVFDYLNLIKNKVKSAKSAKLATIGLSFFLFIDDYLSAMTNSKIGPILNDQFKIPRIQTSFLVTALAAPLCTLAPISSWGAAITSLINSAGISENSSTVFKIDSFFALTKSVPFAFFSIFIVFTAIFISTKAISFGVVRQHEMHAKLTGQLLGPKYEHPPFENKNNSLEKSSAFWFFMPILLLVFLIFFFLMLLGKHQFFGGNNSFFQAIKDAPAELCLLLSAGYCFIISTIAFFLLKKINNLQIQKVLREGFFEIKDILIILTLAWSLSDFMITDLKTGDLIAQALLPLLSIKFLPACIFLLATIISFSVGSSWATMTILFPTIIPMLIKFSSLSSSNSILILFPCIGAILSGVIFGSGMAPTADLILMTSSNTKVTIAEYTQAQMAYLIPVGICSLASFLAAGFLINYGYLISWITSLIVGVAGIILTFLTLNENKN